MVNITHRFVGIPLFAVLLCYCSCGIIKDWREDNFGALDDFERCSHEFNDSPTLNGHKALGCMKILHDIVSGETESADYIKNLAGYVLSVFFFLKINLGDPTNSNSRCFTLAISISQSHL